MKIKFYTAQYCSKCAQLKPEFENLKNSTRGWPIEFCDVTEEMPKDIILQSLPTIIIFDQNNNELERFVGHINKNDVLKYLEKGG